MYKLESPRYNVTKSNQCSRSNKKQRPHSSESRRDAQVKQTQHCPNPLLLLAARVRQAHIIRCKLVSKSASGPTTFIPSPSQRRRGPASSPRLNVPSSHGQMNSPLLLSKAIHRLGHAGRRNSSSRTVDDQLVLQLCPSRSRRSAADSRCLWPVVRRRRVKLDCYLEAASRVAADVREQTTSINSQPWLQPYTDGYVHCGIRGVEIVPRIISPAADTQTPMASVTSGKQRTLLILIHSSQKRTRLS